LDACFVVREALGKCPWIFHFICLALSPNHLFFGLLVSGKRRCLFCLCASVIQIGKCEERR
jgi:hypothetical protein